MCAWNSSSLSGQEGSFLQASNVPGPEKTHLKSEQEMFNRMERELRRSTLRKYIYRSRWMNRHRAGLRQGGQLVALFGVLMFAAGSLWFLIAGALFNAYGLLNAFIVVCLSIPVIALGFGLWRIGTMIPQRRMHRARPG